MESIENQRKFILSNAADALVDAWNDCVEADKQLKEAKSAYQEAEKDKKTDYEGAPTIVKSSLTKKVTDAALRVKEAKEISKQATTQWLEASILHQKLSESGRGQENSSSLEVADTTKVLTRNESIKSIEQEQNQRIDHSTVDRARASENGSTGRNDSDGQHQPSQDNALRDLIND